MTKYGMLRQKVEKFLNSEILILNLLFRKQHRIVSERIFLNSKFRKLNLKLECNTTLFLFELN